MSSNSSSDHTRRITSSDDLEVSAYLEISQEKVGHTTPNPSSHVPQRESVLVIDFGSQYSRLIARRIRESKVYWEIVSYAASWDSVKELNPRGVVLSGGQQVYTTKIPHWHQAGSMNVVYLY